MQNPVWIFGIPIGKCKIPIGFLKSRSGNAKSRLDFWNPDREMQNPDWIFRIPIGKCKIPIGFLESRSGNAKPRSSQRCGPQLACRYRNSRRRSPKTGTVNPVLSAAGDRDGAVPGIPEIALCPCFPGLSQKYRSETTSIRYHTALPEAMRG